jgi:alpha-tubulin suppressor-like RCC1 family protein
MPLSSFRLNTLSKRPIALAIFDLLYSWGSNTTGGTGLNTITGNTLVPTLNPTVQNKNWKRISASNTVTSTAHSLAISREGELWSWGSNDSGRTGLGETTGNTLVPTRVGSANNWAEVSAGFTHSLAVTTNGELWAWGGNTVGQLGRGNTTSPQTTPVRIGTDTNWLKVCAGVNVSFAIKTNGELWAWGTNGDGRTGLGTTSGNTLSPTRVGTATNWREVSSKSFHVVAVNTLDQLFAWGNNSSGELGRGNTTTPQTTPLRVGTSVNWKTASAGSGFTLGVTTTGELWAAGANTVGQLGRGNTTSPQTTLVRIGSLSDWSKVSAGSSHSVAVKTNGELWAWGENTSGQIGINSQVSPQTSPVKIGTDTDWSRIDAGSAYALATKQKIKATGGIVEDITINGVDYKLHKFETAGSFNFQPLENLTVDVFIVGGGGGTANFSGSRLGYGCGGGGGGVRTQNAVAVTSQSYTITVGAGGTSVSNQGGNTNGGDSSAFGFTSNGGIKGADRTSGASSGAPTTFSGASGDDPGNQDFKSAGSGGGAGGAGTAPNPQYAGANGGPGLLSSFTGTSIRYAAGAGGRGSNAVTTDGANGLGWDSSSGFGHGGRGSTNGRPGVIYIRYPA